MIEWLQSDWPDWVRFAIGVGYLAALWILERWTA